MATTFDDFGFTPPVLQAIAALGFETPTPVQSEVIPAVMKGERDLIALAQTGTGKTAAYGLPLLQRTDADRSVTQTLILCPTRELCLQIARDLKSFSKFIPAVRVVAVYGGAAIDVQIRAVVKGPQFLVATPGRLLDLIRRKKARLVDVRQVVLDEADEMLNMGFQEDLEAILDEVPDKARKLLFSATMPRPVAAMAGKYLQTPEEITVGTRNSGSETVSHEFYRVHAKDRYAVLKRILDFYPTLYGIVFCRTRLETQEVAGKLVADAYNADALHGELSQPQRDRVMERFRLRHLQILVATDVAARGLDVTDLTHVIHYSLPEDADQYTHRSGRTGRAGKSGTSIAIIHLREEHRIAIIERSLRKRFTHKLVPSGTEVCAAQLHALLERVKQVEVDEKRIAPYMEQIDAVLAELPAVEVLKRFASLELNRFLEYYKNAADLNAPAEHPRGDRTGRQAAGPARDRAPEGPVTRVTVNLGRRNGFTPPDLLGMLNRAMPGERIAIGRIDIGNNFTVFEVCGEMPDGLCSRLELPDFRGRRVQLRLADAGRR